MNNISCGPGAVCGWRGLSGAGSFIIGCKSPSEFVYFAGLHSAIYRFGGAGGVGGLQGPGAGAGICGVARPRKMWRVLRLAEQMVDPCCGWRSRWGIYILVRLSRVPPPTSAITQILGWGAGWGNGDYRGSRGPRALSLQLLISTW